MNITMVEEMVGDIKEKRFLPIAQPMELYPLNMKLLWMIFMKIKYRNIYQLWIFSPTF